MKQPPEEERGNKSTPHIFLNGGKGGEKGGRGRGAALTLGYIGNRGKRKGVGQTIRVWKRRGEREAPRSLSHFGLWGGKKGGGRG